ncbi:MAG: 2-C-methyl-D-erythritol 4-phosphate cytidylyltransferase [Spirochaetales bacterium]|nr:2-C-methyl-D-erythritol 4-phosphate cytidylyltransferase [Spirochaetales bacterium]
MNKKALTAAVIITAAGTSNRMGAGIKKEFRVLNNLPVLLLSVKPFVDSKLFSNYIIVLPEIEFEKGRNILTPLNESFYFVPGGLTRQESVFNGLLALENKIPGIVLIHDGARPWISKSVIEEVYRMTSQNDAAIPVVPSINAMKSIDSRGTIITNLKREFTVAAQTPQGFNFSKILSSHRKAHNDNLTYIDDAEIYSKYAGQVATVAGDIENKKITYQSDMESKRRDGSK